MAATLERARALIYLTLRVIELNYAAAWGRCRHRRDGAANAEAVEMMGDHELDASIGAGLYPDDASTIDRRLVITIALSRRIITIGGGQRNVALARRAFPTKQACESGVLHGIEDLLAWRRL